MLGNERAKQRLPIDYRTEKAFFAAWRSAASDVRSHGWIGSDTFKYLIVETFFPADCCLAERDRQKFRLP